MIYIFLLELFSTERLNVVVWTLENFFKSRQHKIHLSFGSQLMAKTKKNSMIWSYPWMSESERAKRIKKNQLVEIQSANTWFLFFSFFPLRFFFSFCLCVAVYSRVHLKKKRKERRKKNQNVMIMWNGKERIQNETKSYEYYKEKFTRDAVISFLKKESKLYWADEADTMHIFFFFLGLSLSERNNNKMKRKNYENINDWKDGWEGKRMK